MAEIGAKTKETELSPKLITKIPPCCGYAVTYANGYGFSARRSTSSASTHASATVGHAAPSFETLACGTGRFSSASRPANAPSPARSAGYATDAETAEILTFYNRCILAGYDVTAGPDNNVVC